MGTPLNEVLENLRSEIDMLQNKITPMLSEISSTSITGWAMALLVCHSTEAFHGDVVAAKAVYMHLLSEAFDYHRREIEQGQNKSNSPWGAQAKDNG